MSISQFFFLYLMPWVVMLGIMLAIGLVFRLAGKIFNAKLHRARSLVAGAAAAALAFIFLRIAVTHGFDDLPFYLRCSLSDYGLCGAIMAWAALVDLGALLSEQMGEARQAFAAADKADG